MEEGNLYRLIDYSNSYIAVKEGMSVYWDLPRLGRCKFNNKVQLLARSCGVPVGRRAAFQSVGVRAAILDFLGSHRRNGRIKKLIFRKLVGGSNNLRFNLFPDPVSHFGLSGRLGVAGGAALQAVSECPRRR